MNRTKDGAIEIKLIDFEYAAHFSPTRKTQHGTLASLAPEVVME
jgi:serine/threonine protein kinase